jgi:hypothetical protein
MGNVFTRREGAGGGGRLTYFGIVVNAVVVSTMIAFSTGMWGGAPVNGARP